MGRRAGTGCGASLVLALLLTAGVRSGMAQDPFVDRVVSFRPAPNGGFNRELLPGIVMGPPVGAGALAGSFDVVSLGDGGEIVVGFDPPVICDGPGPDFTVFENPFHQGSPAGPVFAEYGIVAVSRDGVTFVTFPYDPATGRGLAGKTPVLSAPGNGIDPLDPAVSGGDAFDLAAVGLPWAAYVRITDPGPAIPDPGNRFPGAPTAGFDLDAVAALHACDPFGVPSPTASATPTGTPTPSATPTPLPPSPTPTPSAVLPSPTDTPSPTATATPTAFPPPPATPTDTATVAAAPTATPTAGVPTAVPTPTPGLSHDLNGDGRVDAGDVAWLGAAIFRGDGGADGAADVNGDGAVTAADITALLRQLPP